MQVGKFLKDQNAITIICRLSANHSSKISEISQALHTNLQALSHRVKCRVGSRIDELPEVKRRVFIVSPSSSSSPGTSLIDGDLLKDTSSQTSPRTIARVFAMLCQNSSS